MTGMYEWQVRVGTEREISSCGVTDRLFRAFGHMLRATAAAPRGKKVLGRVTVIELALSFDHYERLQTVVLLERGPRSVMRGVLPSIAVRLLPNVDAASRRQLAEIDLCGMGR